VTPGCGGAVARALVADGDQVWVAWSCGDGGGSLVAMGQGEELCPLDPGASWVLGEAPAALAVSGGRAWIGGAGGIDALSLADTGASAARLSDEAATAMASTAALVYAVVGGGRLVRVSDAGLANVSGLDPGLTVGALAATGTGLYAAASAAGGEGRLLSLLDGGVPTLRSLSLEGESCRDPSALAVDGGGRRVVLACADGPLAMWSEDQQTLRFLPGLDRMEALAFDDGDDVVFAMATGGVGLTLIAPDGATLHRFSLPARPGERPPLLVPLGQHRLATATSAAALAVLTPFDGRGPCAGGTTP
jgi:hypothetical protein